MKDKQQEKVFEIKISVLNNLFFVLDPRYGCIMYYSGDNEFCQTEKFSQQSFDLV